MTFLTTITIRYKYYNESLIHKHVPNFCCFHHDENYEMHLNLASISLVMLGEDLVQIWDSYWHMSNNKILLINLLNIFIKPTQVLSLPQLLDVDQMPWRISRLAVQKQVLKIMYKLCLIAILYFLHNSYMKFGIYICCISILTLVTIWHFPLFHTHYN